MAELKMPAKGKGAAQMLQELNAEHAAHTPEDPSALDATKVTTLQETPVTTNATSSEETNKRTKARTPVSEGDRQARTNCQVTPSVDPSLRATRLRHAIQLGQRDDVAVVTVRVSARLNEYMDRFVQRLNQVNPKLKYRKQDAVLEAFAAFYAEHPLPPAPAEEEL